MFVALIAVDLGGKCNFELTFPVVPTIAELRERIISICTAESAIRRPAAPLFEFHRAQVFDERMDMWVDLVASSQLEDYCQIYVFQRESQWHKDTPGRIPPPTKPAVHSSHPPLTETPYKVSEPTAASMTPSPIYSTVIPVRAASPTPMSPAVVYNPVPEPVVAAVPIVPVAPVSDLLPAGHIPYSDKIRTVYDDLDVKKTRAVTLEEWRDSFERLRLISQTGLSEDTVIDLFQKTDRNEDALISFTEFQYFAELYPKIVDSLHFRSRRYHQDVVRKQRLASQRELLAELENHYDTAKQATVDAELAAEAGMEKINSSNTDLEQAEVEEQEATEAKFESSKTSEDMRTAVKEAKVLQVSAREAYKKIEVSKKSAERGVETMQKKLRQQEAERDRVAKEVERLARLLQEQQRELDKKEQAITDVQIGIEEAQKRVCEIDDPQLAAQREHADSEVNRAELDLRRAVDIEAELAKEQKTKQRNVHVATAAKQTCLKENQDILATHTLRKEAELRAEQQLELHKTNMEKLEEIENETELKRDDEEAKENELLQMEVRLRDQREAMEKKEEALRTAHLSFTEESGRVSPRRSAYQLPTTLTN